MSKSVKIDLGSDRLLSIASRLVDEHNYIGALKMLNKNAVITGNDEDSYMLYAEIFDDMGLYERSVHHWFKFLDVSEFSDLTECYEGLATGYMNLGNDHFSAYYYNKLLIETDGVDDEMREQIVGDFLSAEENPLKFVWPPELADVSDLMDGGMRLMKAGDFEKAGQEFEKVPFGNPKWSTARNYLAMCRIICDRPDEAEAECLNILKDRPDDIQALITLAAVNTEKGDREKALAITKKLLGLKTDNPDELYKIATVCCENKLHAEAYKLFCKMGGDYGYDLNVLFFKAVSAFNAGLYEESFSAFDELLTIYPDAVTAEYFYNTAREMRGGGKAEELGYFYTLPQDLKQSSVAMLAALAKMPAAKVGRISGALDVLGPVRWCFETGSPLPDEDLQSIASRVAVLAREDDYVRDLLLNPFIADKLKFEILADLAARNEDNSFGAVVCNVYKRITVRKIYVGRKRRKNFVSAYANLVAHFSILDDAYGEKFALACENLYGVLERAEKLDMASDSDGLAAAVFERAAVTGVGIDDKNICAFFDITENRLQKFRGL